MTLETYRAGDPVLHQDTRKLIGHLVGDIVIERQFGEIQYRLHPKMSAMYQPGQEATMETRYIAYAWLRPAFHTPDIRILWFSCPVLDIDKWLAAGHLITPASSPNDHDLVKIGDAAKVVLTDRYVQGEYIFKEYLNHLAQRGDAIRNQR